jgi:hypothetical protein
MGCTNLVAVPPATKDGEIYLLWNLDILPLVKPIFKRFRFFVANSGGYNYVTFGRPGWLHIGMMNEKGLCFVGNSVGVSDGSLEGVSVWEIIEKALSTCSTVEEVARLYTETNRLAPPGYSAIIFANFNSMWADEHGNAVTIEYSKNHIAVKGPGEDGVMVETNHHQYLDRKLSGSTDPSSQKTIAGSYARLGRAWELAREYSGKFDLETVIRFASDHGMNYSLLPGYKIPATGIVDDSTICCHLWNVGWYLRRFRVMSALEAIAEGDTNCSFILQPKKRTIWFCRGNPCRSKYVKMEFGEALQKSDGKLLLPRLVRGRTGRFFLNLLRLTDKILPVR